MSTFSLRSGTVLLMADNDKILFEFALERWRHSELATSRVYTLSAALGTYALAISAGAYGLIDACHLPSLFLRVDVFLYYGLSLVTALLALVTWALIAIAVIPKKGYQDLACIDEYRKWANHKNQDSNRKRDLRKEIVQRISESERHNRQLDAARIEKLRVGFTTALIASGALAMLGLMSFVLGAGGIQC